MTGALGYSGRHVTHRLLRDGANVVSLTRSLHRPNPFGGRVALRPLCFEDPDALTRHLEGAEVLVNTYWVRFNHRRFSHAGAVRNSRVLFEAARRARIRRIVHVSITNPSADSPLSYFRGKAEVEQALQSTGIPHTILRPAVFFGGEDILINNIAWALRRFPCLGCFGDGAYRLRPVHVDDFAELVAQAIQDPRDHVVLNAVGPESVPYRELLQTLGRTLGTPKPILPLAPWVAWLAGLPVGWWQRDVFITRDEIRGLMAGLLDVEGPATGSTALSVWLRGHADELGRRYASELRRRS